MIKSVIRSAFALLLLSMVGLQSMALRAQTTTPSVSEPEDSLVSVRQLRQLRRAERRPITSRPRLSTDRHSDLALRTNLLRWLTFTPEVGLIWHMDEHWDLQLNMAWSSASWHLRERRYGLWMVSPEVCRYLGQRERWYVGLQGEVSKRHYKFTDKGREGWILGGGLVTGYQWPVGRHVSIDLHLGAGYNGGRLKEYDLDVYFEGQTPQRTYRGTTYYEAIGLNHLGISLVWEL